MTDILIIGGCALFAIGWDQLHRWVIGDRIYRANIRRRLRVKF